MWASELRNFLHFHIKKLLFLSLFCWYKIMYLCRYKWHTCRLTCTDIFPNVPTKLQKSIMGGGGGNCPPAPAPPLATLVKLPYRQARRHGVCLGVAKCLATACYSYAQHWALKKSLSGGDSDTFMTNLWDLSAGKARCAEPGICVWGGGGGGAESKSHSPTQICWFSFK